MEGWDSVVVDWGPFSDAITFRSTGAAAREVPEIVARWRSASFPWNQTPDACFERRNSLRARRQAARRVPRCDPPSVRYIKFVLCQSMKAEQQMRLRLVVIDRRAPRALSAVLAHA